jgi:type I restriction enzyme S subunit
VVLDREYSLLGVRWYAEGLFVREQRAGIEIAAKKLYRVESGDFVYNRLFAWKGAFALARDAEAGSYVSNEFPCFCVDSSRVEPEYLLALFSDPSMWDVAFEGSTGGTPTSRNRLSESKFLAMEIRLPPIDEQQRIGAIVDRVRRMRVTRRGQVERADAVSQSVLNAALRDAR